MSKTVFSSALFEQMGGVNWMARPGGFEFYPHNSDMPNLESSLEQTVVGLQVEFIEEVNDNTENHAVSNFEAVQSPTIQDSPGRDASLSLNKLANVVVVGAGLGAIWQNEETQAWLLWQNIMLAFDWDESQVVFFDTSHLVSDEMIFTTMEEIIDLGVDWVLTMDDEHSISLQLVEGVHVVSVPDLESMLSDPYAKQSFYHAVIELSKPH